MLPIKKIGLEEDATKDRSEISQTPTSRLPRKRYKALLIRCDRDFDPLCVQFIREKWSLPAFAHKRFIFRILAISFSLSTCQLEEEKN